MHSPSLARHYACSPLRHFSMSGQQIQPVASRDVALEPYREGAPPGDWGGGGQEAAPEPKGPSLGRYLAAVNRFKWLILVITALGAAGGVFATRFITPEYEVQATILLEQGTGVNGTASGPIQGEQLLKASGWQDLLRSYTIADPVVTELALFVTPAVDADSLLFRGFRVDQSRLRAGEYLLKLAGGRYTLTSKAGLDFDSGVVGDSIGRPVGFSWQPAPAQLTDRKEIAFSVQTPREASISPDQTLRAEVGEWLQLFIPEPHRSERRTFGYHAQCMGGTVRGGRHGAEEEECRLGGGHSRGAARLHGASAAGCGKCAGELPRAHRDGAQRAADGATGDRDDHQPGVREFFSRQGPSGQLSA
ncbi:MAG: hypothetical protein HEQ11_01725 [Gemmatimonas sp.]